MWIPSIRRERVAVAIAALALPALSVMPSLAAETAHASNVARLSVAYCIPASTAMEAAAENAQNTSSTLSSFADGSLASAGSFAVPVGASSAGTIAIKLTGQRTSIGSGSAKVAKSGCYELTIVLTSSGRKLLQRDEASKTPVAIVVKSTFTPVRGSGKAASAVANVTLQP